MDTEWSTLPRERLGPLPWELLFTLSLASGVGLSVDWSLDLMAFIQFSAFCAPVAFEAIKFSPGASASPGALGF